MPKEIIESEPQDGMGQNEMKYKVVGYQSVSEEEDYDAVVMAINDSIHCDGRGAPDYAEYVAKISHHVGESFSYNSQPFIISYRVA